MTQVRSDHGTGQVGEMNIFQSKHAEDSHLIVLSVSLFQANSEIALSSQNSYLKLLLGLLKALGIGRVDDVDEDVRVVKVIPPVRTDLPLPANVPDVQPEP